MIYQSSSFKTENRNRGNSDFSTANELLESFCGRSGKVEFLKEEVGISILYVTLLQSKL